MLMETLPPPPATQLVCVTVPIRVRSLNDRAKHWATQARRMKAQRSAVHWMLKGKPAVLPCVVTLCRIAPSDGLDAHDNLPGSLKPVADGVCDWLGTPDNDPRVTWHYSQERGKVYGVRVTIESTLP